MTDDLPLVSVALVTYNQDRYVRRAMESIASQEVTGDYEVVVADDDSTDETLRVIESFRPVLGDRLRVLPRQPNMGTTKNYERVFKACRGAFTATLEGDDYWTSPARLQKHLDVFASNSDVVMCFNRTVFFFEELGRFELSQEPKAGRGQTPLGLLTGQDVARGNPVTGFSACSYRTAALRALDPAVYDCVAYDWIITLMCGRHGLIGYLPEVLSTYRIHDRSLWSSRPKVAQSEAVLGIVPTYDRLTEGRFHEELEQFRQRMIRSLLTDYWRARAWRPFLSMVRDQPEVAARGFTRMANPFRAVRRVMRKISAG